MMLSQKKGYEKKTRKHNMNYAVVFVYIMQNKNIKLK